MDKVFCTCPSVFGAMKLKIVEVKYFKYYKSEAGISAQAWEKAERRLNQMETDLTNVDNMEVFNNVEEKS